MALSAAGCEVNPVPIRRFAPAETVTAIEIGYRDGRHPDFDSDADFRVFGATIASLHKGSRRVRIDGAGTWDVDRVARHFEDPRLLAFVSAADLAVSRSALDVFGMRYKAMFDQGTWTGLVHSDAHRHNVVMDGDRGFLIDCGECGQGVLFWDLGVAVADSAVDCPDRATACREYLVAGYLDEWPDAAVAIPRELPVFEAMRCLEVMTWPVSD